jgi:Fe-S-cluster containining protein
MRCDGDRCTALDGEIGKGVRCKVYNVRPIVCRDCLPGDDACLMARAKASLPPLGELP